MSHADAGEAGCVHILVLLRKRALKLAEGLHVGELAALLCLMLGGALGAGNAVDTRRVRHGLVLVGDALSHVGIGSSSLATDCVFHAVTGLARYVQRG